MQLSKAQPSPGKALDCNHIKPTTAGGSGEVTKVPATASTSHCLLKNFQLLNRHAVNMTSTSHEGTGLLYFFFTAALYPCGSHDLFFPVLFSQLVNNNEQLVLGRYGEDVTLPCPFTSASNVVIHWKNQDNPVHTYYSDMDHLETQYHRYANRTSLFHSEIHNGNASLTIRRLSLLDEGIYTCYVGTNSGRTDLRVVLKVGAFHTPLMKYEQRNTESFLECSILSVYPHPRITWKMDNAHISESNSEVIGTLGPFYIKSMLNITGLNSSFECTIENLLLNQAWRGKWTLAGSSHWMNQSESISLWCPASSNFSLQNQDFLVTWSRVENGIYSVLDWHLNSSQDTTTNNPRFSWKKELRNYSDFPITLKHLRASDSGEYLCNVSLTGYTLLTVHRLHVEMDPVPIDESVNNGNNSNGNDIRHHFLHRPILNGKIKLKEGKTEGRHQCGTEV
ncbi:HERV-H LTR-associating protein 2 [Phodopus roborovskii]|uniref:HERV-H LTR-associating protein 2 n=1 Tax=Phodopus roborovskii TaxID=109678 RepID=UPI0021E4F65A|nr:HERV-H LTR-associating protein 2 [Phodopus roborovskii]